MHLYEHISFKTQYPSFLLIQEIAVELFCSRHIKSDIQSK